MAKNLDPTNSVLYTFNEGKTWHELEISSTPIDITNIIIEPYSISQQFVIYGSYVDGNDTEVKGIVITVDFKNLHEP
jgi:hypothetical protein